MAKQVERAASRYRARAKVGQARRERLVTWGLIAIAAIAIGVGGYVVAGRDEGATPTPPPSAGVADVGCSTMEQLGYHVHVHLAIFLDGKPVAVAANVGIRQDCITWLHTHDDSGVLHVEAPEARTYPLGAFFRVWGQPLDATHLLDRTTDGHHKIQAFVNGQLYAGAPELIPLDPHAVIVLEYGPPFVDPPPYAFPAGL